MTCAGGAEINGTALEPEVTLEGVPLWLFVVFSSLALLGVVYTIVMIAFNVTKSKTKLVKMTSPNINVVILVGVAVGYGCVVLGGLDSGLVSAASMQTLQRAVAVILPIAFTLVFGALFAKAWRVFLVFKNLNFNGKLTRDEHLLLGVLIMLLLDLAILLPWILVDPITCQRKQVAVDYQVVSAATGFILLTALTYSYYRAQSFTYVLGKPTLKTLFFVQQRVRCIRHVQP